MSQELIEVGEIQEIWNVSDTIILKYTVEMYHKGLNEHKLISAPEIDMLKNKGNLQGHKWIDKWKIVESKRKAAKHKEANLDEAASRREEAMRALSTIDNLLIHTLSIDDTVDWNSLKKNENFDEEKPSKTNQKTKKQYPPEPEKEFPVFTFFEKIIKSKKERKINDYKNKHSTAISNWERKKIAVDKFNVQLDHDYKNELRKWDIEISEWGKRRTTFLKLQKEFNASIENMEKSYQNLNTASILEYCDMVLNNSEYPESFPKNFELEYNPEIKILIIEYELPPIDCLPTIK